MAYPTNALPQMRNETNIQVRLDDNEGSIFAALFWAAGIVMSPLGGALSGNIAWFQLLLNFVRQTRAISKRE